LFNNASEFFTVTPHRGYGLCELRRIPLFRRNQ